MTAAMASWSQRSLGRLLVVGHRWLGVALGPLAVAWFLSGFVMLWHGMPALEEGDRLARLPPLDLGTARLSPSEALGPLDLEVTTLTIGTLGSRPVYRSSSRGRPITVFADTGRVFQGMSRADALDVASAHLGAAAGRWRHRRLVEPDQWTLQARSLLPMHRFRFEDGAATAVYVSERTGRVELVTDRASRRWGWLGPVVHWVYFEPIRRHSALWLQGMIWASLAGVALTVSGLAWGLRTWLRHRRSPYRGWMHWHHVAGLCFGLLVFTWMGSGLLSLDPWGWHPGTSPGIEERRAVRGGGLDLESASIERLRLALQALSTDERPRELELGGFRGRTFVHSRSVGEPTRRRLAWLGAPEAAPAPPLPPEELIAAAKAARPGAPLRDAALLERGDTYYYRRSYEAAERRLLPVFRVRFDDDARTAFYFDPLTGSLLHREQRLTRLNRWLYHGLHSWDHPALLGRPAARRTLMILLLCGGLTVSGSALIPGVRRVRRMLWRSRTATGTER